MRAAQPDALAARMLLEVDAAISFMPKDLEQIHEQAAFVAGYVRRAGYPMDIRDAILARLTVHAEWREVTE